MKAREIIIYLSIKNNGNWVKTYNDILNLKNEDDKNKIIDEEEAKKLLKNIHSKVLTILDEGFPDSLKTISRPPFCLFYHGDISLLDCKMNSIAVVGSRKYSEYGKNCTNNLVKDLAKELTIVSGMAIGIDSIAHNAALSVNGKTIAVLGSGINYVYPSENKDLYEIIKRKGLIISEYYDCTTPTAKSFPWRNRIVAGLTNCVLVPEGKINSGSQITASMVANNGGYVCCVPTRCGEESLCNLLIKQGACLVENSNDVYEEMGYQKHKPEF